MKLAISVPSAVSKKPCVYGQAQNSPSLRYTMPCSAFLAGRGGAKRRMAPSAVPDSDVAAAVTSAEPRKVRRCSMIPPLIPNPHLKRIGRPGIAPEGTMIAQNLHFVQP